MKLFCCLLFLFLLSGCDRLYDGYDIINTTKSNKQEFKIICIDNVEYLLRAPGSRGYFAPHFKPDGSLYTCNMAL